MREKIDPYKHKERYENWLKNKNIKRVSKSNEKLIINFLDDMALGINISKANKKGARSYSRLNNLRQRMTFITKRLEERGIKDLRKVTGMDNPIVVSNFTKNYGNITAVDNLSFTVNEGEIMGYLDLMAQGKQRQ